MLARTVRATGLSGGWLVANFLVLTLGLLLIALGAFRLTHPDAIAVDASALAHASPCPVAAVPADHCYQPAVVRVTNVVEQASGGRAPNYEYWIDLALATGNQRIFIPACGCRLVSLHVGDVVPIYYWHGQIAAIAVPSGHVLSTDQSPMLQARSDVAENWLITDGGALLCLLVVVPRRQRRLRNLTPPSPSAGIRSRVPAQSAGAGQAPRGHPRNESSVAGVEVTAAPPG